MCNLYTLDGQLNAWAEDFHKFLDLRLVLPAGAEDGTSNLTYAKAVYPKYQGLFVRPIEAGDPEAGLEPAVGRWGVVPYFHKDPVSTWKFPTNNCRSEEMAGKASFETPSSRSAASSRSRASANTPAPRAQ
jgi:putative SOS response-associated peptidase YedK